MCAFITLNDKAYCKEKVIAFSITNESSRFFGIQISDYSFNFSR